jgi:hypothetical protein
MAAQYQYGLLEWFVLGLELRFELLKIDCDHFTRRTC